ncbi:MAG TPA: AAA family ATPase [Syntrophomonadaceae bacterium]|nr:AAA family ATPase [Syntrophomonadaceae bacterium]
MEISMRYNVNSANKSDYTAENHNPFPKTDAFNELENLIGLKDVKKILAEVTAFSLIQSRRSQMQLKACPNALHMVFKGNPGTGKTTVARILGGILRDIGILSKGQLVEVERADLVGEYIGHTAQKTREMLKKSLGGIMFIDEAYTLAQGGEKDFGREAVATLVKAMEDHRDNLVIILAGYSYEMERFLRSNPGLRSRFPIHINFPDYNVDELLSIAVQMYTERDYELTCSARWKLKYHLQEFVRHRHPHSGNARYVRNLVEKSIRRQALRIVDREPLRRKELVTIEEVDLPDSEFVNT